MTRTRTPEAQARWDALTPNERELMTSRSYLTAYQRAINKIDDYFEYRMESKVDQAEVREILSELTGEISRISERDK